MSVTLSLFAGVGAQFLDNNGVILSGGLIYTYTAGTTTPLTTYTTNLGTVAQPNPIVLDSAGRIPGGELWLTTGYGYKFVTKDSNGVLIGTYDNVPSSAQPPITNNASSISYEVGAITNAGYFRIGYTYKINYVGTTNFELIGASSNVVGTIFIATGIGSGSGTAEESRTVQSRLQDHISVKDFGATGDGVTNDTISIQNALDYVGNLGGGEVYVPAGTYIVTALIIKYANIRFYGDGDSSILLADVDFTAANFPTIWVTRSNVVIENFYISYVNWNSNNLSSLLSISDNIPGSSFGWCCPICINYDKLFTSANSGIYATYRGVLLQVIENIKINNVTCVGATVDGVVIANTTSSIVSNCRISEFRATGIFGFISPNIEIYNNTIFSSMDDCIYLQAPDSFLDGIYTPILTSEVVNAKITNNTIKKSGAKGVGISTFNGVIISNNYIESTRSNAIWLTPFASNAPSNCVVSNNTCLDIFGGYGSAADGFAYTTSVASIGIFTAIELYNVNYFTIDTNIVICTKKSYDANFRGFIGPYANNYNGIISNNIFDGFSINNLGQESDSSPDAYSSNIKLSSNIIICNETDTTFNTRMTTIGTGAENISIINNIYISNANANVNCCMIYAAPSSQIYASENSYTAPNGLATYSYGLDVSYFIAEQEQQNNEDKGLYITPRNVLFNSIAPTTGTWKQGDIIYNINATSSGYAGWICTVAGTPGTWNTFGLIS